MSLVDNMFNARLDNDSFSSGAGRSEEERLTQLLAAFELNNPSLQEDIQLKSLPCDSNVIPTMSTRTLNLSPPPGFAQLPIDAAAVWPSSNAYNSRNNSEFILTDNQLPYIMPKSLPLTLSATQADPKMLTDFSLLQRYLDRSTSAPVGQPLSPELSSLLAELENEGACSPPLARYKTELCRPFEEHGTCKYGDKCQFAHGRKELRSLSRHPKYKTDLCKTYHTTGLCPYGPRCHFIHNDEEAAFNRAGIERQRMERALAEQLQTFKLQVKQHQLLAQQQQQQQQQLIAATLLKNMEQNKSTYASPLKSSDFLLNQHSGLDGMGYRCTSYNCDSLDSLADKSPPSSVSDESLVSSPSFSMFSSDEINNSLNSTTSLNGLPSFTSLDSVSTDAPTTATSLHGISSSQTSSMSFVPSSRLTYTSADFITPRIVPSSFVKSPLSRNLATPGYGRIPSVASSSYESNTYKIAPPKSSSNESLNFAQSEAAQQEIFKLALTIARTLTSSASSACGDQRLLFQQLLSGNGIAL